MKIVLLAAAVVLAIGQDPQPAAVEHSPQQNHSLLFTQLKQAGFSQFCVSEALDQCSKQEKDGHLASLMEEMRGMVQEEVIPMLRTLISLHNTTTQDSTPPRHCKDILDSGDSESGLRDVFPDPARPHYRTEVYCEQGTDGGGWTVFQRRSNDSTRQSFDRTWAEYVEGFGEKTGEFWLGLEDIHLLTMTQQVLRIDLDDYEGEHRWAKYGVFYVDSEHANYSLVIGMYSGDAGDAMRSNNGAEFSTHDADHDTMVFQLNCAAEWHGGWWYKACSDTNLNGYQHEGQYSTKYPYEGIMWKQWRGYRYSLKRTTMMIRPVA